MNPPLPIPDDHWQSRWLVRPSWRKLHRVSDIVWDEGDDGDLRSGMGVTVCGLQSQLCMPGILSRLSLPRCSHCCRGAGVPDGNGAPANFGLEEKA